MKYSTNINSSTGGTGGETLFKHFQLANADNFKSAFLCTSLCAGTEISLRRWGGKLGR